MLKWLITVDSDDILKPEHRKDGKYRNLYLVGFYSIIIGGFTILLSFPTLVISNLLYGKSPNDALELAFIVFAVGYAVFGFGLFVDKTRNN